MLRIKKWLSGFLCLILIAACNNNSPSANQSRVVNNDYAVNSVISADSASFLHHPLFARRAEKIRQSLSQKIPIIFLDSIDNNSSLAQVIASSDEKFRENLFDKKTGEPYRNEIFNIYPARPQDLPPGVDTSSVYRVEMYNYALNLTTIALVNISLQQVIAVNTYQQTQPDLNKTLEQLAIAIAVNSPEVINALGFKPGEEQALMASTKTALNHTRCERSMHLCVAPTFIKDNKALWAIVDLTDNRLVGIRWTNTGTVGQPERISEKKLLVDKVMECNCREQKSIEQDGWKMNYIITSSDGLRISEVYYKNQLVVHNAKLVDWHVSYSGTDGFGYSDAVGCPEFSHAAVLAVSEPRVSELLTDGKKTGFVLEQSFKSEQWPRPCNYNYIQRYEFYSDGRFRTVVASLGRGCGNDGTYRPVTRIVFAGEQNNFSEWKDNNWLSWTTEQWRLQDPQTAYTKEGYQYKIATTEGKGFYVEPGRGQFRDGGRGDNAFVYVTKFHPDMDEGDADLVTIGPCCNTDYKQGPEKFIGAAAEDIRQSKLVVWYVAQLKNDDAKGNEYCWAESYLDKGVYKTKAYPCMSGPMFIPIQQN